MSSKRDRSTPRTAGDIERKYGQTIKNTEEEVESQAKDLASLNISVKELIQDLEAINIQIERVNQKYEDLGIIINKINIQVEENTKLSHSHENKEILDSVTEKDISSWNYRTLANNPEINQTVDDISKYNVILVLLENIERYIPLYKYQNSYKGIDITSTEEQLTMNEIIIETEEDNIINISSNNPILEIVGAY